MKFKRYFLDVFFLLWKIHVSWMNIQFIHYFSVSNKSFASFSLQLYIYYRFWVYNFHFQHGMPYRTRSFHENVIIIFNFSTVLWVIYPPSQYHVNCGMHNNLLCRLGVEAVIIFFVSLCQISAGDENSEG